MHVSSLEPSVVHRFAPRLYLIMISVILLLIVVEGVLIGPSLFAITTLGAPLMGTQASCSCSSRCCCLWSAGLRACPAG